MHVQVGVNYTRKSKYVGKITKINLSKQCWQYIIDCKYIQNKMQTFITKAGKHVNRIKMSQFLLALGREVN